MAVVMGTGSQSLRALGSKTKLRGGGREGKGGLAGVEGEPSQEEARVKLVGLNRSKS